MALSADSWALRPTCHSFRWLGVIVFSSCFFSSACWETEMGGGSGDLSETVLPGTYLILKKLLLLVLGMSVTLFLNVPFSSTIFLWVLSRDMLASRTRFRVTLYVARVSAETPMSLTGPLVPESRTVGLWAPSEPVVEGSTLRSRNSRFWVSTPSRPPSGIKFDSSISWSGPSSARLSKIRRVGDAWMG